MCVYVWACWPGAIPVLCHCRIKTPAMQHKQGLICVSCWSCTQRCHLCLDYYLHATFVKETGTLGPCEGVDVCEFLFPWVTAALTCGVCRPRGCEKKAVFSMWRIRGTPPVLESSPNVCVYGCVCVGVVYSYLTTETQISSSAVIGSPSSLHVFRWMNARFWHPGLRAHYYAFFFSFVHHES